MRTIVGHNDRNKSYLNYWDTAGGAVEWPKEVTFSIPTEGRWPPHRKLAATPGTTTAASTTGKCASKLIVVSGLKYSMRGGYSAHHTGPGVDGELTRVLVEAANHSLASSTWKSYSSVWARMGRISGETGVRFSYPMSVNMVRTLTAALIQRGLKSGTILSYMAAVRQAHILRGLECPALEDKVVKAALKGIKNRESLTGDKPRAVMTIKLLAMIRAKLKTIKITADRKRLIWCVCTFLFLGSMRGSEILSTDRVRFDPVKTMCGEDLKLATVQAQGETVETITIRLKSPKTSRSNPVQMVELPATGGWLCPVKAWRNWRHGRKASTVAGKPVFTWKDGTLVTLEDINRVLTVLLPGMDPRITTRAFRPALPSILAREGASEAMLKALGRWTSRTYLHYVREGRTGDWRGLLTKLRELAL